MAPLTNIFNLGAENRIIKVRSNKSNSKYDLPTYPALLQRSSLKRMIYI